MGRHRLAQWSLSVRRSCVPATWRVSDKGSRCRAEAGQSGSIPLAVAQQLAQQARNGSVRSVRPVSSLPLPHPLDFEWRFTNSAASDLLERAVAYPRSNEPILLLGTPSVAAAAIDAPVARHIHFIGGDNSVTRCIAAANAAAGHPISISSCRDGVVDDIEAAVVVLDPPWYLDFIRPMLAMAATACRPGGTVLISLPPMGTRASAEDDRQKLLRYAGRLSLSPIETEHGRLAYDMPFFERNALTATGMNQIPADWRRGDLVVFRKTGNGKCLKISPAGQKTAWREVSIGRMRLFVRSHRGVENLEQRLLRPIVHGDVLPSVSRRDPRRRRAQVWTSGNRIFATDRPDLVLSAAKWLTMGGYSRRDHDGVQRLGYALQNIASIEDAEERGGQ